MVALGMVQVLEERCFGHLTVEENIISGLIRANYRNRKLKTNLKRSTDISTVFVTGEKTKQVSLQVESSR